MVGFGSQWQVPVQVSAVARYCAAPVSKQSSPSVVQAALAVQLVLWESALVEVPEHGWGAVESSSQLLSKVMSTWVQPGPVLHVIV
jgi:hypothetical protein